MKKFLLSLLLVLVSSFAYGAVGDGFIVDGLRFIVTSEEHHEVEVTDYNYIYHNSSTDVVIPAQVTHNSITYTVVSIGENGFYHKDLTSVMIPATVREIGMYAFFSCYSLTGVDIPDSVSEIGQYAFGNCSALESVELPASLGEISQGLLITCTALKSITIPESVKAIGPYAFFGCIALESVEFSKSVREIGDSAFSDCIALESIHLPGSLESIGAYAFSGCTGFSSVGIPECVTEIGTGAFLKCEISEYQVDEANQNFCTLDGILYNKDLSELVACPDCKSGDIVLPGSVLEICDEAFCYCEGLTSVTFTSSVTRIGNSSFGGCTALRSIDLPSTVACIDGYAFFRCSSLVSVRMPDTLTEIGERAFGECPLLISIRIPAPVVSIGNDAFTDCTALTEIQVDDANRIFSSVDGVLLNKDQSIVIKCPMGKTGSFAVPETVMLIRDYAFLGCYRLSSVVMSGSIREIGDCAFKSCSALESVVMSNSIKDIGAAAFLDCSSLLTVKIPSSVHEIKPNTFQNCIALSSVVIPISVRIIERYAFNNTSLASVHIPASVKNIGTNPFGRCKNLMQIEVDENNSFFCSVDGVLFNKDGNDLVAFPTGRTGSYEIPEGVRTLAENSFIGSSLSEICIAASVNSMKRYVFVGCESLDTIYCMGTRPPGVLYNGEQLFPETVCENSILFVPESALGAYRNRWPWSAFANIQTFEPSGISEVDADKDIYAPMEIYTPGGVYVGDKLDVLSPGFYIVRQGITSRKVVVR